MLLPWRLCLKMTGHLLIMAGLVKFITYITTLIIGQDRLSSIIVISVGSIVGGLVFICLSVWQQTLTDKEWELLPKGADIIELTKKLRKKDAIR